MLRKTLILIFVLLVVPLVHAQCEEPSFDKFPGYSLRYNGTLAVGEAVSVQEFKVEVEEVYTNAVNLKIWRYDEEYTKASVVTGEEYRAPYNDIIIQLHNTLTISGKTKANISVYTPWHANLTTNFTIDAYEEGLTSMLGYPAVRASRLFEITIEIKNTGEIAAKNIVFSPKFKDFEIVFQDIKNISFLCPNSTYKARFTLKAPMVWEIHNYSLILEISYQDENPQTGKKKSYVTYGKAEICVIGEANIKIEKKIHYPWDFENNKIKYPAYVGDKVKIVNKIENKANYTSFYGEIYDVLPEGIKVVEGNANWSGRIPENTTKWFSYTITSDVPIIFKTYSIILYKDTYGNVITRERSERVEIKFIEKRPEIEIKKEVIKKKIPFEDKIKLDINESIDIKVTLKNKGNTKAYNVKAVEESGLPLLNNASWHGNLAPGEEISYIITVIGSKEGEYELKTKVTYEDEFKKEYSKEKSIKLYVNAPMLVITHSFEKEIYYKNMLEVEVKVKNAGSKAAYNVLVTSFYPEGFILRANATQRLAKIDVDETITLRYNVSLPEVKEDKEYSFYTIASYQDDLENLYLENSSSRVKILSKIMKASLSLSGKTLMNINDYAEVVINLKNTGDREFDFEITTKLPENLNVAFGKKDSRGILKKGEEVSLTFIIKAIKGGEGKIECIAIYDNKNITKQLKINVKGPKIKVSRGYTTKENKISLLFKIENYGEETAYNITVIQPLIKEKKTIFIANLSPKSSYSEKIDFESEDNVLLKPYTTKWFDIYGNEYTSKGKSLEIKAITSEAKEEKEKITETKEKSIKNKKGKIFIIMVGVLCYAGIILIVLKKVFK